jgi:hypothetical protein
MIKPIRLQLSRAKGFNLQAVSRAANGVRAVNVARPSRFGNLSGCMKPHGCRRMPCGCCPIEIYCCVDKFEEFVRSGLEKRPSTGGTLNVAADAMAGYPYRSRLVEGLAALRGKNVACWCKPGEPCHADILLELANA